MSTSINSGVEEEEPGANLLRKGKMLVMVLSTISVPTDDIAHEPSLSGGLAERESLQSLTEEPISHARTSALKPHAMNDKMAEEDLRLRTQIQHLIVERASGRDPDTETYPPPAYVKDV
ncbi:hypothetical protein DFS33DRAFT_1277582 [Desarmillaria ectypa]|nr:hypothetical protein DFS33DRAFT_1277582 [Desarmillaria ectypa]